MAVSLCKHSEWHTERKHPSDRILLLSASGAMSKQGSRVVYTDSQLEGQIEG